jgi:RNA polymerase II subunit A-like phosphatase
MISNSSASVSHRKRLRSVTPSEGGVNGENKVHDALRSPLAKRKKIASDRSGYSKLKEAITADDLKEVPLEEGEGVELPPRSADEAEEEFEEEEDEDDFLARELGEEWG